MVQEQVDTVGIRLSLQSPPCKVSPSLISENLALKPLSDRVTLFVQML